MAELANAGVAARTEQAPRPVGCGVMIDMEAPNAGAGRDRSADGALTILHGQHFGVGAVTEAKTGLERAVGFLVWVFVIPLAIIISVSLWVIAMARQNRLRLAWFAPGLQAIAASGVAVKIFTRLGYAASLTQFHPNLALPPRL